MYVLLSGCDMEVLPVSIRWFCVYTFKCSWYGGADRIFEVVMCMYF